MDDVLIIGAGLAGLTLAYRLKTRGIPARVLDARERVGGRTDRFVAGEHRLDLGATWVWQTETAILDLARELEVELFPSHRGGMDLYEGPDGLQRVRLPPSPVPEFRIDGGARTFCDRLAGHLDVELGQNVRSVSDDGDHVVVELVDDTSYRARRVVLALPPALIGDTIALESHSDEQLHALKHVPVWMGDMAKVVIAYDQAFWRTAGLSGRVFSHRGPMVEVHDMSARAIDDAPALFGFVPRSRAHGAWREAAVDQLVRLFGERAGQPRAVRVKAWWEERETVPQHTRVQSVQGLFGHPFLRHGWLGGKVFLGSTETSAISTGHLDGAVRRAEELADFLADR